MMINNGRTNVELWGARLGKGTVQMFPKPQIITPTGSYNQSLDEFYQALLRTFTKGTTEDIPLTLLVTNEKKERFTFHRLLTPMHGTRCFSIA